MCYAKEVRAWMGVFDLDWNRFLTLVDGKPSRFISKPPSRGKLIVVVPLIFLHKILSASRLTCRVSKSDPL